MQPVIISDVNSSNTMARTGSKNVEIGTNSVYRHLKDHDYLHSRSPKKRRNRVKITELKAIYNCITCGYRTMDREVLHKHICIKNLKYMLHSDTTKKLPPKRYEKCLKCNFTENQSNLTHRMESHNVDFEKNCIDCVIPKINIDRHTYQCSMCNYSTQKLTNLKIHRHIHSRGIPFKCTECEFSGSDMKQLIKHYEEAKDLYCKCGYTTHLKRLMAVHLRSHTGEKPYSCGICSISTSDRAGLHRHMKNKHIID